MNIITKFNLGDRIWTAQEMPQSIIVEQINVKICSGVPTIYYNINRSSIWHSEGNLYATKEEAFAAYIEKQRIAFNKLSGIGIEAKE
ncbi:MAG: hypothetical protein SNH27_07500 [Rikenellaceae bacterium]